MAIELPVAIIPARYASTRFPGKPLALLAGKPMLQHVWLKCMQSRAFSRVIIATDDERIASRAHQWGSAVQLTSSDCVSGTDRVAEVAKTLPDSAVVANVQGDEPLVTKEALLSLSSAIENGDEMATLIRPLKSAERTSPDVVKVVISSRQKALYFSRADIPFARDSDTTVSRFAHIGLYAYRRETLLRLAQLPPSPLEVTERLEQLRALENGISIRCMVTSYNGFGIDSPEDLRRAERLMGESG